MVNRFCECLECDAIFESGSVLDKVRPENVFTYCSTECQDLADIKAKELETHFNALDEESQELFQKMSIANTESTIKDKPKSINEVMQDFLNAQSNR